MAYRSRSRSRFRSRRGRKGTRVKRSYYVSRGGIRM